MSGKKKAKETPLLVPGAEINSVQRMLNDFCILTACAVAIFDTKGKIVMHAGITEMQQSIPGLTKDIFAECGLCCVDLAQEISVENTLVLSPCPNGLYSAAAPVIVNGRHVFNVLLGHFNTENSSLQQSPCSETAPMVPAMRAKRIIAMLAETMANYVLKHNNLPENDWVLGANRTTESTAQLEDIDFLSAIKELKESKVALEKSETRYRALVANIPAVVYRCEISPPWYMNYISEPILTLTGYNQEDFYIGGRVTYGQLVHPDDMAKVVEEIDKSFTERRLYEMEYRIIDINGCVHWVFERGRFFVDEFGAPLYLDGVIMNISETMEAKAQLQSAFDEREVLVKEIHHRVKNNLQAIIHLIDKQAEALPKDYRIHLDVLKSQAYTMALIYDQLNKTKKLSKIEMFSYFEELALNVGSTFNQADRVLITVESDEIWMDVSQAMPCAMIVNELIINTYKHAFPASHQGDCHLLIRLAKENHKYTLTVRDNGVGVNMENSNKNADSSGMVLMKLWAEHQLGGTFKQYNQQGLVTEVSFLNRKV